MASLKSGEITSRSCVSFFQCDVSQFVARGPDVESFCKSYYYYMQENLALIDFKNPCVFQVAILHTTFSLSLLPLE